MKKLIILLLVCFAISFSQSPVKKLRLKNGTADITIDSVKVVNSQLVVYLASGGYFVMDSSLIARIGGVVDYNAPVTIKNNAVYPYIQEWYNSRSQDIGKKDSNGINLGVNGTAAAPTYSFTNSAGIGMYRSGSNILSFATAGSERVLIDAAGRFDVGTTSQTSSKFAVRNTTTEVNLALLENEDGTEKYRIDSTGTPFSATIATGVDSFTTTSATDSVTLADSYGFSRTSKVLVSHWNPDYSTEVDTAIYSGQVVITGENLTKLVVTRVKSYTGNGAAAVKSGAQYYYEVKK